MKRLLSGILSLAMFLTFAPSAMALDSSQETNQKDLTTDNIEEVVTEKAVYAEQNNPVDNDLLFAGYVEKQMYAGINDGIMTISLPNAGAKLTGNDKKFYDLLKPRLERIASEGGSTVFTFSLSDFGWSDTWSAEDLGVPSIENNEASKDVAKNALKEKTKIDIKKTISALLADMPYELYWFDKTQKYSGETSYYSSVSTGSLKLTQWTYTFTMRVVTNYATTDSTVEAPKVAANATSVAEARINAEKIVSEHFGDTIFDRLVAYKTAICNRVSYNHTVADEQYNGGYGDPWQLIYVFDNDTSNQVVCEGYSKAFQYLCDLGFKDVPNVTCYTVTGNMNGGTGEGAHMWNIVRIDDTSYLVDVTNCDTGTVGAPNYLFMVGAKGSVDSSYTVTIPPSDSIIYTYDKGNNNTPDQVGLWGTTILTLSSTNYTPPVESKIKITPKTDITYDGSSITIEKYSDNTDADITYTYTGISLVAPTIVWTKEGNDKPLNSAPTDAGTYTVTVTIGEDSASATFTINPKPLAENMVTVNGSLVYSGQPQTATVTVNDYNNTLKKDTDYTVSVNEHTDAGKYELTVTGTGNYTGTVKKSWEIAKKVIYVSNWTWEESSSLTYSAQPQSVTLSENNNYIDKVNITYTDNEKTNAGNYTATAKATIKSEFDNNYEISGDIPSKNWVINKAVPISAEVERSVRYSNTDVQTFTLQDLISATNLTNEQLVGAKIISAIEASDNKNILDSVDITQDGDVQFKLNSNLSANNLQDSATITITFSSTNYEDSTLTLTVKLVDTEDISQEIVFDDESVIYNGSAQEHKLAVLTDTPNNGTWTYEYKQNGNHVDQNNVKNVGTYTVTATYQSNLYHGSKEAEFTITPAKLTVTNVTITSKEYDGQTEATVDSVSFNGLQNKETLTKDTDYTIEATFADANRGTNKTVTYTINLKENSTTAKNYTLASAEGNTTGTINPKTITVTVAPIEAVTYTGSPLTPAVTVTSTTPDVTLTPNDYTVAYSDNTDVGTATVTVTPSATSNYTFTEAKTTFTINKATYQNQSTTVTVKVGSKTDQTVDLTYLIDVGGTVAEKITVADTASIISGTPTFTDGKLTFTPSGTGEVGDTATITLTVSSENYNDYTITVTVTLAAKENQAALTVTGGTVIYGQTLTLTTTGGSGTGAVTYTVTNGTDGGTATISGNVLTATHAGTVTVTATKAADDNYNEATSASVTITITKATPTGTPTCTAVSTSGKTLADAVLSGTFTWAGTTVPGTLSWTVVSTTEVQANAAYSWTFTPTDTANYNSVTGTLTPWTYVEPTPSTPSTPSDPSSQVTTGNTTTPGGEVSTQTTAQPSTTVSGTTASTTLSSDTGDEIVRQAVTNDSEVVVVAPKVDSYVNRVEVAIPGTTLSNLYYRTDADVCVETPVMDVTIRNSALASLGRTSGNVVVTAERNANNSVDVEIRANGRLVESVAGGVKLEIPSTRCTPNTVAVLVRADGTTEIIRTSLADSTSGTVNATVDGSATVMIMDNSKTFTDVNSNAWYKDAVDFASSHEIMNGTATGVFSPQNIVSRGTIAMLLYHVEHDPNVGASVFTDTADSAWYTDAVTWASNNNVVKGYGNGTFGPNDSVTREQMAVMLYNFAVYKDIDMSVGYVNMQRFNDAKNVSGWADTAVRWAVANGLLTGKGNGLMDPQGIASRAEIAAIVMRFCAVLQK